MDRAWPNNGQQPLILAGENLFYSLPPSQNGFGGGRRKRQG
jgi:hypothetical protein